jgi:uncharacterized protein
MELLAAFTIGLLGSLHCIGMCGPIALALPVPNGTKASRLWAAILYNLGRAFTYALLGTLFGAIGQALWMLGLQQALSLSFGIFIILLVVLPALFSRIMGTPRFYRSAVASLQNRIGRQFKKRGFSTLFIIGMLNGLLPCGFVYIALAGAAATGQWYTGAAYMALFGLGTLPLMASLILVKNQISLNLRRNLSKALPYAMVLIGSLFILRGMNLGIPYLSPKAPTTNQNPQTRPAPNDANTIECH